MDLIELIEILLGNLAVLSPIAGFLYNRHRTKTKLIADLKKDIHEKELYIIKLENKIEIHESKC